MRIVAMLSVVLISFVAGCGDDGANVWTGETIEVTSSVGADGTLTLERRLSVDPGVEISHVELRIVSPAGIGLEAFSRVTLTAPELTSTIVAFEDLGDLADGTRSTAAVSELRGELAGLVDEGADSLRVEWKFTPDPDDFPAEAVNVEVRIWGWGNLTILQ